MRASWHGTLIAESEDIVTVEGNSYFPLDGARSGALRPSDHRTACPWKGTAHYFDVVAEDGEVNKDAAWTYPEPKEAAAAIRGRVAFWKGVRVGEAGP